MMRNHYLKFVASTLFFEYYFFKLTPLNISSMLHSCSEIEVNCSWLIFTRRFTHYLNRPLYSISFLFFKTLQKDMIYVLLFLHIADVFSSSHLSTCYILINFIFSVCNDFLYSRPFHDICTNNIIFSHTNFSSSSFRQNNLMMLNN